MNAIEHMPVRTVVKKVLDMWSNYKILMKKNLEQYLKQDADTQFAGKGWVEPFQPSQQIRHL